MDQAHWIKRHMYQRQEARPGTYTRRDLHQKNLHLTLNVWTQAWCPNTELWPRLPHLHDISVNTHCRTVRRTRTVRGSRASQNWAVYLVTRPAPGRLVIINITIPFSCRILCGSFRPLRLLQKNKHSKVRTSVVPHINEKVGQSPYAHTHTTLGLPVVQYLSYTKFTKRPGKHNKTSSVPCVLDRLGFFPLLRVESEHAIIHHVWNIVHRRRMVTSKYLRRQSYWISFVLTKATSIEFPVKSASNRFRKSRSFTLKIIHTGILHSEFLQINW